MVDTLLQIRYFVPQDLQAIALQFHAKKRLFCKQGLKMWYFGLGTIPVAKGRAFGLLPPAE